MLRAKFYHNFDNPKDKLENENPELYQDIFNES